MNGTVEQPEYRKVEEDHGATPTFMIVCDEGWREHIVCTPASYENEFIGGFRAVTLHVRYDVEPWKMNPCTCGKKDTHEAR